MLTALLLASLLVPQSGSGCKKCKYTGTLPCEEHTEDELVFETEVDFCSVAASCATCKGAMVVDCPKCDGGPSSHLLDELPPRIAERAQPNEVEQFLGRAVPRFETDRYELIVDVGIRRNGKKTVDEHTLGHWLVRDLRRIERLVAEHYDEVANDYDAKMRMWIWGDVDDHLKVMTEFLHTSSTGDFAILGRDPMFAVWTESPNFDTVPEIRSLFAHHAGHLLTSNLLRPQWVGDIGGGWFDGAVGHWYEYAIFGDTTNYCIEEANIVDGFGEQGQWRAAIRKELERDDERQLPRLSTMLPGAMRGRDQALCWSFYDYLVANHRPALRGMLEDLKVKVPTRDVFPERLGMSLFEAEDAWRAWVAATYEPKEKRRRVRLAEVPPEPLGVEGAADGDE